MAELVRLVGRAPSVMFRGPTCAMKVEEIDELVGTCAGLSPALQTVRRLHEGRVVFDRPPELTRTAEVPRRVLVCLHACMVLALRAYGSA